MNMFNITLDLSQFTANEFDPESRSVKGRIQTSKSMKRKYVLVLMWVPSFIEF